MLVTGRKTDTWLVKTFGGFIAAVGASLLVAADGDPGARRSAEQAAVAAALTLATAEAWYVARGRISPIYLADTTVEVALALAVLSKTETDLR